MNDPTKRPLLADIRAELDALAAEFREMAAARWELARLELQADLRSAKRLAIVGVVAALMALTALPLLAVCLADLLDGHGHIARAGWLLIFGASLLLLAVGIVLLAVRRFRRRFVGLQETLEEARRGHGLAAGGQRGQGGKRAKRRGGRPRRGAGIGPTRRMTAASPRGFEAPII